MNVMFALLMNEVSSPFLLLQRILTELPGPTQQAPDDSPDNHKLKPTMELATLATSMNASNSNKIRSNPEMLS
jgi:hypothetical protein